MEFFLFLPNVKSLAKTPSWLVSSWVDTTPRPAFRSALTVQLTKYRFATHHSLFQEISHLAGHVHSQLPSDKMESACARIVEDEGEPPWFGEWNFLWLECCRRTQIYTRCCVMQLPMFHRVRVYRPASSGKCRSKERSRQRWASGDSATMQRGVRRRSKHGQKSKGGRL